MFLHPAQVVERELYNFATGFSFFYVIVAADWPLRVFPAIWKCRALSLLTTDNN